MYFHHEKSDTAIWQPLFGGYAHHGSIALREANQPAAKDAFTRDTSGISVCANTLLAR